MNVKDFKNYVEEIRLTEKALGNPNLLTNDERNANRRKRSIIVINEIKKNEIITKNNIKVLRPNIGDNPINFEKAIKRRSKKPENWRSIFSKFDKKLMLAIFSKIL